MLFHYFKKFKRYYTGRYAVVQRGRVTDRQNVAFPFEAHAFIYANLLITCDKRLKISVQFYYFKNHYKKHVHVI